MPAPRGSSRARCGGAAVQQEAGARPRHRDRAPAERFAAERLSPGEGQNDETMTTERKPVAFGDMRNWMKALKSAGELREIDAEVDWNVELGTITRLGAGPGHRAGAAVQQHQGLQQERHALRRRCSPAALGSYRRVAMMMGLPPDTHPRELVKIGRTITEGRDPAAHRQGRPVQGEHRHRQGHRPVRVSGAAVEPGRRRPLSADLRRRASPRTRRPT